MYVQNRNNKAPIFPIILAAVGIVLLSAGFLLFISSRNNILSGNESSTEALMDERGNLSSSELKITTDTVRVTEDIIETEYLVSTNTTITETTEETEKRELYRVRKSWDDPSSQLGAWRNINYAISNCPIGYYVYDEDGNIIYNPESDDASGKPALLQVPDINGVNSAYAITRLEADHFVVVIAEEYNNTVPEDYVISQSPAPNTIVEEWSEITLHVSKGQQPVRMIKVVGQSHDAARQALERLGLFVSEVWYNEYFDDIPFGVVVTQSFPEGADLKPGTEVTITISIGPKPVETTEPPTEPPTQPSTVPPTEPPTEPLAVPSSEPENP